MGSVLPVGPSAKAGGITKRNSSAAARLGDYSIRARLGSLTRTVCETEAKLLQIPLGKPHLVMLSARLLCAVCLNSLDGSHARPEPTHDLGIGLTALGL